jgi:hypothetical protein
VSEAFRGSISTDTQDSVPGYARPRVTDIMAGPDLLPSWRPGHTKTAILDFLESVTSPGPTFVPWADRIAAFGSDGTLWCEKPAQPLPARARQQPWKAVIEDDHVWLASIPDQIPELTASAMQEGLATGALDDAVWAFFNGARHPVLGIHDTKIAYRPMCELVALLETKWFQVYISSADHRDLVRVVLVDMQGISSERVGPDTMLERQYHEMYQSGGVEQPTDEGMREPGHLWARMARTPLLAGGNADSDTAMLKAAHFALMISHGDARPESTQRDAMHRALAEADERGWTVVSVKDDFKEVF